MGMWLLCKGLRLGFCIDSAFIASKHFIDLVVLEGRHDLVVM